MNGLLLGFGKRDGAGRRRDELPLVPGRAEARPSAWPQVEAAGASSAQDSD